MLASDDMADVMATNLSTMQDMMKSDLLADLTDIYASATDYVKKYTEICGDLAFNMCSQDGRLYSIPTYPTIGQGNNILYIRADWLKNLNLDEPKNFNDVIRIAEAFAKEDPDQNGEDDTLGFILGGNPHTSDSAFFNSYHAYPTIWVEDEDGSLVYGSVQPEIRDGLLQLQKFYQDGVISKEFGTFDWATRQEAVTSGKGGVLIDSYPAPLVSLQATVTADENADWKAYPIMDMEGFAPKVQSPGGNQEYVVVSKYCEHPEAVIPMMDLFAELFLETPDFESYTKFVDNEKGEEVWQLAPPIRLDDNVRRGVNVHKSFVNYFAGNVTKDEMVPEAVGVSERAEAYRDGDRSLWCWDMIYKEDGALAVDAYYFEKDVYLENKYIGSETATMKQRNASISKILDQAYTDVIKGADISAFDEAVEQWKSLGGDQITQEVNEWYRQYQ